MCDQRSARNQRVRKRRTQKKTAETPSVGQVWSVSLNLPLLIFWGLFPNPGNSTVRYREQPPRLFPVPGTGTLCFPCIRAAHPCFRAAIPVPCSRLTKLHRAYSCSRTTTPCCLSPLFPAKAAKGTSFLFLHRCRRHFFYTGVEDTLVHPFWRSM